MMKEKFPHLSEYGRRCKLISEDDEEYYSKFQKQSRREHEEFNLLLKTTQSNQMARNKLGGDKKIHKAAQ